MRTKALNPEEREKQVITWFEIRFQHDNHSYASMYAIARGLGMSPSSHLTRLLRWMVDRGVLSTRPLGKNGRFENSRGYRLKKKHSSSTPKEPRQIKVNSRNGQMMLEL